MGFKMTIIDLNPYSGSCASKLQIQFTPPVGVSFTRLGDEFWHDALFDATASLVLLVHLINTLGLNDHPVEQLERPDTSAWHRTKRL
jgi:hypothetical protein